MVSQQVKAIRVDVNGGPEVLKLVSVDVPEPGANEVRIRQKVAGLNFVDIYFRSGHYKHPLPHGLGNEASGVVETVGSDVRHLKVGDRVAYGSGPLGAYAEMCNVPASAVVKLPASISFEEGAAIMLKGLTAQYLLRQTYRLQGGETILFHAAAGGVGLIACQWASALGVKVIGTASGPEKVALAKANGAWEVIDYSRENIVDRVMALTGGKKVPVVYDGVGKDTWLSSLDCLQPRGLMVSFGSASGPVEDVNLGILSTKGSLYVTRPTLRDFVPTYEKLKAAADDLFSVVRSGKVKVRIGQRFSLSHVADAHRALAGRKTVGATILTLD
ncbi:MAG: quinone oxidoreductase [Burkholderiaceae bacterium]|nr:MAG: quinone oxidoreductase [Burkholderiaceae bacterium]